MKIAAKLLSVSILALGVLASARAAVETYVADPAHSSINFTIRHIFTDIPGQFSKYTATVTVDRDNLAHFGDGVF